MSECSTTCQRNAPGEIDERVLDAACTLAGMLTDTREFQRFVRMSRAVRLDEQVEEIMSQINGYVSAPAGEDIDALEGRLEALPVVREYQHAERAVRGLFTLVEQAISGAAGLNFAENAKPAACG